MPTAIPLLRALLVVLAVFFGVGLGRSLAAPRRRRLITWSLRIIVVLFGICWYGVDLYAVAAIVLAAAAVAAGYYRGRHPAKQEHLEDVMFPKN